MDAGIAVADGTEADVGNGIDVVAVVKKLVVGVPVYDVARKL